MATVMEIVEAAERLRLEEFLRLRTALDTLEEKLWERESGKSTARHREKKLTDSRIDQMVFKRRYKGRAS